MLIIEVPNYTTKATFPELQNKIFRGESPRLCNSSLVDRTGVSVESVNKTIMFNRRDERQKITPKVTLYKRMFFKKLNIPSNIPLCGYVNFKMYISLQR